MRTVCAFLALVIVVSGCTSDVQTATPIADSPTDQIGTAQSDADNIKSQLQTALVSGGITPEAVEDINKKIVQIERTGYDTTELRQMLAQLEIGGSTGNDQPFESVPAPSTQEQAPSLGIVRWEFNTVDNSWKPSGNPPACPPLVVDSPIDVNKATSLLYPGQFRPDYKPHGGFRFDGQSTNDVDVRSPFDGYVWRANRRYASGQLQYNIEIIHPCGINTRLDHLLELTPEIHKLIEALPQPQEGDSRTTELGSWKEVKKGELIATKVGVANNVFMDWGMYDFRAPNDASKNELYSQTHWEERWNAFYALCWLDLLPSEQQTVARSLPGGDEKQGKNSDYC